MKQLHKLMLDAALLGQTRETRSGTVRGVFRRDFVHDMRTGLPFPMAKRLMFKAMMGELLWFINGETTLESLRMRSNLSKDAWTIWTDDCNRWHSAPIERVDLNEEVLSEDGLGRLYGDQWRRFGETPDEDGVDQLKPLVYNMSNAQTSRYLIVQAYNPKDVIGDMAALPPCHTGFQVYVDVETGEFDLDWTQRSVDLFLGLPFNCASYGMLMLILGQLTGLTPRFLYGSLKDCHVYEGHLPAVHEQLIREPRPCLARIDMPEFDKLSDLQELTAEDFVVLDYTPDPAIKAPLLVG